MEIIWDLVLKSIAAVASWPVIVLVIALVYQKAITRALQRLSRYKGFGQEFEFGEHLAELEASPQPAVDADQPAGGGAEPEAPGTGYVDGEDIARRAEEEPSFIILSSWEELSLLVRNLAAALGSKGRKDPYGAISTLKAVGFVGASVVERYESLRSLRDQVAHGQHRPTPGEAITYAAVARRLRSLMVSYARHPSKQKLWEGQEDELARIVSLPS